MENPEAKNRGFLPLVEMAKRDSSHPFRMTTQLQEQNRAAGHGDHRAEDVHGGQLLL